GGVMPSIAKVPVFKRETDSGNLAFLAAQAALSTINVPQSMVRLAGASGDVFKFSYDNAPIYEPLRDYRRVDTLARAFAAAGLRAEWVPEATLDHVRGQVEAHAAIGQPVLAAGLPGMARGEFVLLTGYDEDSDTLSYRHAAPLPAADAPFATLSLADNPRWDGPLTGAPHWADFPLMVVRGPLYNPPDERAQRQAALTHALETFHADPGPYPRHPGAQACADVPLEDRQVQHGLAAFELLAEDIAQADFSASATLWRLDAMLRQLAWDRTLAGHYLEGWEGAAPPGLMARYRTVAHTARTLLTRTWEQRTLAARTAGEVRALVESTAALVYALPDDPALHDRLRQAGPGRVLLAERGPALLLDSPNRRDGAVALARRLHEQEIACETLIKAALSTL
ncbi:MAG: hypothetical protein JXN59_17435, partial [Anaerolineae bacterium]|nr:hypothetical protein [Anaerolineae bacterium]